VSLGRLIGSDREHIEQAMPHIGSLLEHDLGQMLKNAQVVVIGTRGVSRDQWEPHLRPDPIVLDLVNLDSARRLGGPNYEGICW
jgi:GDP-mannose 6-dehydrogenase